jgi:transforming growth factor-beta-induced protein
MFRHVAKVSFPVVLLAGSLAVAACSDDESTPAPSSSSSSSSGGSSSGATSSSGGSSGTPQTEKDIVDTAIGAGSFKTLVSAVQAAGLESTLRGAGPFTVFAPTDDAFAKVPSFLLTKLTSAPYKTELALILKYHVLSANVKAADVLGKTQSVDSVLGAKLAVDGSGGKVVINGSANVTQPDVTAKNGTIHVIDGVLLPTIVDTAVGYVDGATKFSTLVAAVQAAELVETLSGPGTFTVFAPTDAAFEALKTQLGASQFDAILADKAKLQKILTYHVLPSTAYEKDVAPGSVKTVEGGDITITVDAGQPTINGNSKIVFTDLPNSNGVIHVIDTVLLPPDL